MDELNKSRQKANDHNKRIYKCEICDRELKNKDRLKSHVKVVHKFVNEHQCNICQKLFKLHTNLPSHIKVCHENKKNHKCDSCGKTFK